MRLCRAGFMRRFCRLLDWLMMGGGGGVDSSYARGLESNFKHQHQHQLQLQPCCGPYTLISCAVGTINEPASR